MRNFISGVVIFCFVGILSAQGASITYVGVSGLILKHFLQYSHYKIIGACSWLKSQGGAPYPYTTLELDEYLPDLVVSVFDKETPDPLWEAGILDSMSESMGNQLSQRVVGFHIESGRTNIMGRGWSDDSIRTKTVDVIGSPLSIMQLPMLHLRSDTTTYKLYYQSNLDALGGRLGIAELLRPELLNPLGHFIGGNFSKHWGSEFPREMTVNVQSNFRASVIVALHAADLVTNKNTLHTVQSTEDSCGKNCAVANVVEENKCDHEILEEVYPNDRLIQPGVNDSELQENQDEKKGKGSYVFLIWRHYRGCVQGDHFLGALHRVEPTKKR